MIKRKVDIGGVIIGGTEKVAIQSMTNTKTVDIENTLRQIGQLYRAGCDIVRVAVPDARSAEAIREIKQGSPLPLVADIHFDYKLALAALENGADKVRVNPGNLGGEDKLSAVCECAKALGKVMRIGVNTGSLMKSALRKTDNRMIAALWSLREYVEICEKTGFRDIVLSVKSSDVKETVMLNRMIDDEFEYPLHLGVTEAGIPPTAEYKSAIGIGALLIDGIGDTIRVSLTDDPVKEVEAAKNILDALKMREGVNVIACPTCARTEIDVIGLAREIKKATSGIKKKLNVAVMGCVVNGPGEAAEADVGIAGGRDCAVIFRKGVIVKKTKADYAEELMKEIGFLLDAENT